MLVIRGEVVEESRSWEQEGEFNARFKKKTKRSRKKRKGRSKSREIKRRGVRWGKRVRNLGKKSV